MRTLASIVAVLMVLEVGLARPARAETTTEVVLLGRGELLAQNVPQRRLTRIERFVPPAAAEITDPALSALDDAQAPLLAAIPSPPTVWEPLVGPQRSGEPRQRLVGTLAPREGPLPEDISPTLFETEQPLETVLSTWAPVALFVMVVLTFRRWIFAMFNRGVLWLVVAVHQRGAKIDFTSSRGGRRRRRRSRRRSMDVSWYFRSAGSSRRRRSRGWSRSYRPREYVVTDAVYATAPAPQYLLTHS